MNLLCKLNCIL